MSEQSNSNDVKEHITIARRCMEQFLCEMKRCSVEGSTEEERVVIAERYLSNLESLPKSPLMAKLKQLIGNFIDGKARHLNTYVEEQAGESRYVGTEWLCTVCGKRNHDNMKKYNPCITCGKPKGYVVSKKLQQLNGHCIDATPHLTNATNDDVRMIKSPERHREKVIGDEGKKSFLMSTQSDYEALERTCIKSEIDDVLSSIRQSLDGIR